jgi:hypothetical protein
VAEKERRGGKKLTDVPDDLFLDFVTNLPASVSPIKVCGATITRGPAAKA